MADVAQKAISANDIKNGAVTTMPVSPVVGDQHETINPPTLNDIDTDGLVSRYQERFK